MFRSMTSNVSALSSVVANGHQTVPAFSSPPLKFRTAGFPQYGFKLKRLWRPSLFAGGLSALPAFTHRRRAYTPTLSEDRLFCGPHGHAWRTPSPLRFQVSSAGLCSTGTSEPKMRVSPLYSAHLCQRAVSPAPVNRAIAHGCYFIARTSLRHFCTASAFTSPRRRFSRGTLTRLQSSLYATARWLARPSPTRAFTFELSAGSSPRPAVEYDYAGIQPIPATGLTPVRDAALRAANRKM